MEELFDQKESLKTKRGKVLPVLCVLSWIWLVIMGVYNVQAHLEGPLSAVELENEKFKQLDAIDESMGPMLVEMTRNSIEALDISNENFTVLTWGATLSIILGFIGVILMYKLKKIGFWIYVLYNLVALGVPIFYFIGNAAGMMGAVFLGAFSILFVILYGVQRKRMS